MFYDDVYSKHDDYFGSEPNSLLLDYYHLLDKRMPVLDIGAGQGRHAVFLARNGFSVDAIERSGVAAEALRAVGGKENLPMNVYESDFEDFAAGPQSYSAILIFGLIQELSRESIDLLVEKILSWIKPQGLVFATAHTVDDPTFEKSSRGERIGKNSFRDPDGNIYTYLESNELISLFCDFEVVYHNEGLGPLHHHGDAPPERHATVKAVLRKA
jgi:cyclopropane fatty-acyl-phospholipid synthase-like methyltransferase